VMRSNLARLRYPGDPDLLFPGDTVVLPKTPAPAKPAQDG
jgi:hypothetical protein